MYQVCSMVNRLEECGVDNSIRVQYTYCNVCVIRITNSNYQDVRADSKNCDLFQTYEIKAHLLVEEAMLYMFDLFTVTLSKECREILWFREISDVFRLND